MEHVVVEVFAAVPESGRISITEIVEGEEVVKLRVGGHDVAAGLARDLVKAIEQVEIEDSASRLVGTEKALDVGNGGRHGIVEAARNSNAELACRHENAGEDISKEEGMDGSGKADPRDTNTNRTEFAEVAKRVFVEGGEATRAERSSCGGRHRATGDDTDNLDEGREVWKVNRAVLVDNRTKGVVAEEVD